MDEIGRLQKMLLALFAARNHLLDLQPSDPVVIAEVNERIIAASARLLAEVADPTAHELTDEEVATLQHAVDTLNGSVQRSAAVSEIFAALLAFRSVFAS